MKKITFIFLFLISLVCLTGCYKQEKYEFQEGRYAYNGEKVNFYEDIIISNVFVDLELLTDMNKNVITNRKTNTNYNIDFIIVTSDGLTHNCDFTLSGKNGKVGDQVDRYHAELNISEILGKENAVLILVLEFRNPDYYSDSTKTNATEVRIQLKYFRIGEEYIDSTLYDFPNKLYYIKETHDGHNFIDGLCDCGEFDSVWLNENFRLSDEQILFKGSVDDEFNCDVILLTLKHTTTYIELSKRHFGIDEITEVVYISSTPPSHFYEPGNEDKLDNFNQIVFLYVDVDTKQEIIELIKEIEKLPFVESAGPNYIEHGE